VARLVRVFVDDVGRQNQRLAGDEQGWCVARHQVIELQRHG
jgi:hypothetical protein